MQENYKQAADAYKKALEINLLSPEHATYQLAMSEGYLNNSNQKIQLLTTLVENNPTSVYAPDAKFELAETYRSESMDPEALKVYDELIRDYGEKDFIKRAMLEAAIIENRLGNKEDAIERLKYMIAQYPNERDTKAPLEVLSQIYKETSEVDKFKEYVESDSTLDFSMDQLELVQYEEAENLYVEGNWSLALEKLEKYLLDYEKPKKQMNAFYMAGESALNIQDTTKKH